ncbi:hypothetical protein PCL_11353 [Purpureocillium lilacinum]|uniref:Uncharacterized protein n=1 Tax=Purpureocillium lilacinum TaxID=33203 RepID=A0A2U3DPQ8_PURLI|nr:hypothetical protein PCL_11353 [Purpureocillium lilacinum]
MYSKYSISSHRRYCRGHFQCRGVEPTKRESYREFSHLVSRLGSHVFAARTVFLGVRDLPFIRDIAYVNEVKAPHNITEPVRLCPSDVDPYEIVKKLCTSATEKGSPAFEQRLQEAMITADEELMLSLYRRDSQQRRSFRDQVAKYMSDRNWTLPTMWHAELQALHLVASSGGRYTFIDDDKFIGCSKGACFFCYQYITHHEGGYVKPDTHNGICPAVRLPDAKSPFAQQKMDGRQRLIYKAIKDHIKDALRKADEPIRRHRLSTSGFDVVEGTVASQETFR